ncbi:hypothetical protein ACWFQ8_13120 [Streptomyces sp. NPDC055254]
MGACAILAPDGPVGPPDGPDGATRLPVHGHGAGEFTRGYAASGPTAFVIRPGARPVPAPASARPRQRLTVHPATTCGTDS